MKTKKTLYVTLIASLFLFAACGVEGDDIPIPPVCDDCDAPDPGPVCGDDVCDEGETAESCPDDCDAPDPGPVCGDDVCDEGETAESCPDDCEAVPAPTYGICPFKSDGPFNWNVAGKYVSGATHGEIRFFTEFSDGSCPNPQVLDSNVSGYLGMEYELDAGTYRFSYLGYQYSDACSGSDCPVAWAQYGGKSVLSTLSPECLAFIDCNWWDASSASEKTVDCAQCALKVSVADDGTITGAGNMGNFNGE